MIQSGGGEDIKENLYTIGEISKICGINQLKLRYYDEINVIGSLKILGR